jgi:hypothetical protein
MVTAHHVWNGAGSSAPGTMDSPWGATNVGYIESGEFRGPVLNGRVPPGGGDRPAIPVDGENGLGCRIFRID